MLTDVFILTTGSSEGCNSYVISPLAVYLADHDCAATCLNTQHSALLRCYSFSPASTVMRPRLMYGFGVWDSARAGNGKYEEAAQL